MPDFDVFSLLEFRKRKARSHGIKKNGNCKRKSRVQKLANCTLGDLATKLDVHGRHCMLSYLSSLPISVLRSLDTESNKVYDRTNRLYDAAFLTRCYTQHALHPVIDSNGGGRVVRWCWVNFQCRSVLLNLISVGQGPTALAVGAGGCCLDILSLIYHFSSLSPSLWETTRYRLKYCLTGPLSPNQPTIDSKLNHIRHFIEIPFIN